MSASDHVSNNQFYHGSAHSFKIGDVVIPQGNSKYAHATNDRVYAEGIGGGSVFEVTPLNKTDVIDTSDPEEEKEGTNTFSSPSGFKVIRQVK